MKRILPVFLCFLFLLTVPAFAAGGKLTLTPAVSGDKVTVTVHLENPGIIATRILVRYDAAVLQLTDAKNGSVFPTGTFGNDLSAQPYTILWEESLRRDNNTQSGTLCTLTFAVKGGTESGKTSVRIEVDQASTFDVDLQNVPVADGACSISVPASSAKPAEPAKTTAATTKPAAPAKADTTATKPAVTVKAAPGTTAAAQTGPVKASATQTNPAASAAAEKTTAAKPSSAATTAASGSAAAPATAAQGTTAPSGDVQSAADPASAADASAPADTQSDTLSSDGTLLSTAADDTQSEVISDPEPSTNHRALLWLLLLIPAAAVVILIVKKKSK